MTWTKLQRYNDWGAEYFALPGKGLSEYGTSSLRDYAIPFVDGMRVGVKWPDGTTTSETVKLKNVHTTVGDMGKSYDVSYPLAGFEASTRGASQWYPLDSVEVDDVDLPSGGTDG